MQKVSLPPHKMIFFTTHFCQCLSVYISWAAALLLPLLSSHPLFVSFSQSVPSLFPPLFHLFSPLSDQFWSLRRGFSQMVNTVARRCLSCSRCPLVPHLSPPAPSRPPGHMSSQRLLSIRPNFSVGFPLQSHADPH